MQAELAIVDLDEQVVIAQGAQRPVSLGQRAAAERCR